MKPFELRLAQEHAKMTQHLKNLDRFISDKSRFEMLPDEHRTLILEQAEVMGRYVKILEKRLTLLNIPV